MNSMRVIKAKKREIDHKDYIKRSAQESDFHEVIREPVTIADDEGIKVVYDKLDFDTTKYSDVFRGMKYESNERVGGLKTTSRIFGYSPRVVLRKDFCSATGLSFSDPESHAMIIELGQKIADNSVLFFDGQEIMHGVTPMVVAEDGYRFTAVFYSLQQMWNCLTVDEEIARIRNIKTQREKKRAYADTDKKESEVEAQKNKSGGANSGTVEK